jgi:predicted DNA-binding protein (MmcQ/YjbR family)
MEFEAIRTYCLSLPHTIEDIKWDNDLCFSIGGKMFCVMHLGHPFTCAFKVEDAEFEALSSSPAIIPAPYMARNKWIQVLSEARFGSEEWKAHLLRSYQLVKARLPKKLQNELL